MVEILHYPKDPKLWGIMVLFLILGDARFILSTVALTVHPRGSMYLEESSVRFFFSGWVLLGPVVYSFCSSWFWEPGTAGLSDPLMTEMEA